MYENLSNCRGIFGYSPPAAPCAHKKTSRIRDWFICMPQASVGRTGQMSNEFIQDLKKVAMSSK
jgi:hypothetical protein